jgi:hypothetical protein
MHGSWQKKTSRAPWISIQWRCGTSLSLAADCGALRGPTFVGRPLPLKQMACQKEWDIAWLAARPRLH